jgi:hypothetical protein
LGDNHAVVAISKTTLLSVRNECMAKWIIAKILWGRSMMDKRLNNQ